jgi:peptidoglycan lytic transglycosylase
VLRAPARFCLFTSLVLFTSSAWLCVAAEAKAAAREDYKVALAAIKRSDWLDYEQLRARLDDYPLAIYLDYYKLDKQVHRVQPEEAIRFVSSSQDSPLPNRFKARYLKRAGSDRRWQDFLALMPDEPNAVELKCYYFRAKLATGDDTAAWEGAQRLWTHGKSQPKECDPLFSAWLKSGLLTDDVVWARLLKVFDARQRSLLAYVARQGSDALKPWSDILQAVYRHPDRINRHKLPPSKAYSADIASHGLAYLARYNPAKALTLWQGYQGQLTFNARQQRQVEYAIALHSLFGKTEKNVAWLDQSLPRLKDDKLVELRLRWELAEQDWQALGGTLSLLSEEKAGESAWRYWRAIVAQKAGDIEQHRAAMEALSLERGYYSFLAADRLGKPYAFNNKALSADSATLAPLRKIPAVQRVEELVYHEEEQLAHSEWFNILENQGADRREALGSFAAEQGWYRMAIDAANKAEAWDRLDLRFPMPWQDTFAQYASLSQVPSTELMSIARRESAFYPQANSPVGARGLMQLMPATGKEVASSLGKRHRKSDLYQIDHNVLLGSTYYRQLLDRYNGNRVFALTAYNAGPHRVDRWRSRSGASVPVEVWVETIPYRETRNYVQAVLAYNVVFQHLQGLDRGILSPGELQAMY